MTRFEWDQSKAISNLAKHGVNFDEATLAWSDPRYLLRFDRYEDGEERWHLIGSAESLVMLLVVHTFREDETSEVVRIVSARKATRREREVYRDGNH